MKLKKTLISLVLCAALFFGAAVPAFASVLGDVDGNGRVSVEDARFALRAAIMLESYEKGSEKFTAADADRNGLITVDDARLILRAAIGLEELFDGEKLTSGAIYKLASKFTFEITAESDTFISTGSGFAISTDGVIVTNYHVIDGCYSITATDENGVEYPVEKILAFDMEKDIAVLKIKTVTKSAVLNRSDYDTGDKVYSLGSSLSLTGTFADGMISHRARRLYGDSVTYIQHSAPISHGNSGGPLLDEYGRVIGINTASFEDGQNLNLAIPVSYIDSLDYSNPMTVSEFASRFNPLPPSDDRLVVAENSYFRIEYVDYDYDSDYEARIGFVIVNLTGNDISVYLYDFAVNGVNLNYSYVSAGTTFAGPHGSSYFEITVSDSLTPGGFELTPIGTCLFTYEAYAYLSDGEEMGIGYGITDFYYSSLSDTMEWYPSYSYDFYDYSDANFGFGMYESTTESWDDPNDTMASYFFFRNTTDHTLIVNLEAISVNGRSLQGTGPDNYFTVYSYCSTVPYFFLFYDFRGGEMPLNVAGVKPMEIKTIDYSLFVYDVDAEQTLYYDTWTITFH